MSMSNRLHPCQNKSEGNGQPQKIEKQLHVLSSIEHRVEDSETIPLCPLLLKAGVGARPEGFRTGTYVERKELVSITWLADDAGLRAHLSRSPIWETTLFPRDSPNPGAL